MSSPALISEKSQATSVQRPKSSTQIRIGELVLRGLPRGRESAIAKSLESTLSRMLIEKGVPKTWRSGFVKPAKPIVLRPGQAGESIGEQLAQAMFPSSGGGRR